LLKSNFFLNLIPTIKKIFLVIKMASVRNLNIRELTVKKLTQLAKKRGLKGYSKKINLNWYGY